MTTESPETREEIEEAAATWIARREGDGWTEADATLLAGWLAESAGHRVAYYRLNAVWDQAGRLEANRSPSRYRYLAAAAAVIALLVGTVVSMQLELFRSVPEAPPQPLVQANEVPADTAAVTASPPPEEVIAAAEPPSFRQSFSTAIGVSRVVSLPDGSRVTLDTDSRIQVTIDERSRTVRLERGQAFFEVAHERQRPFAVAAGRFSVIAVGTAFSVRRVGSDIRVVVAEGTVRLERPGERDDLLPAGGIMRVEADVMEIHQGQPTEVERNLSWRSGVLTFRHTSLADAVAEFNRYATRRIVIRDPEIAALELGGVFKPDDIESFVRLLERTFPIDAAINPDRIELSARRSP